MSSKINTILFDFDGTLMNTNDIVIQSWQHTFRTVEGKERPLSQIMRTFGEPLTLTMKNVLPQLTVEEGIAIYRSYLNEHFYDLIAPFPGMVELLRELKERDYITGLVTSRTRGTTHEGLAKFGLEAYFDCVVTLEDVTRHKPDPEPLLVALGRLSAVPEKSAMVGDTIYDILAARDAGVKSILVGWQMALSKEEIEGPEGPDHIIEKPEDLFPLLAESQYTINRSGGNINDSI